MINHNTDTVSKEMVLQVCDIIENKKNVCSRSNKTELCKTKSTNEEQLKDSIQEFKGKCIVTHQKDDNKEKTCNEMSKCFCNPINVSRSSDLQENFECICQPFKSDEKIDSECGCSESNKKFCYGTYKSEEKKMSLNCTEKKNGVSSLEERFPCCYNKFLENSEDFKKECPNIITAQTLQTNDAQHKDISAENKQIHPVLYDKPMFAKLVQEDQETSMAHTDKQTMSSLISNLNPFCMIFPTVIIALFLLCFCMHRRCSKKRQNKVNPQDVRIFK